MSPVFQYHPPFLPFVGEGMEGFPFNFKLYRKTDGSARLRVRPKAWRGAALRTWATLRSSPGPRRGATKQRRFLSNTSFWCPTRGPSKPHFGCASKPTVPFWGRCTTHFRTYFGGDWDVRWGYGVLTHGYFEHLLNQFCILPFGCLTCGPICICFSAFEGKTGGCLNHCVINMRVRPPCRPKAK